MRLASGRTSAPLNFWPPRRDPDYELPWASFKRLENKNPTSCCKDRAFSHICPYKAQRQYEPIQSLGLHVICDEVLRRCFCSPMLQSIQYCSLIFLSLVKLYARRGKILRHIFTLLLSMPDISRSHTFYIEWTDCQKETPSFIFSAISASASKSKSSPIGITSARKTGLVKTHNYAGILAFYIRLFCFNVI
jgi:hypothetical protein